MLERLRISPWAAVAVAALVAAFCGSALAGSQAGQSAKPFTAKKAKKLFDKLIKQRAPTLSVASAQHATTADTATNATNAAAAVNAGTVGGLQVKEVAFTAPADTPATEVFSAGGLSIFASCPASVLDGPEVTVGALGTQEGALKFVGRGFAPNGAVEVDAYQFNSSDTALDLDGGRDRGAAQLSFIREDGLTVNGLLSWDDGIRTGDDLCGVSGALIVG